MIGFDWLWDLLGLLLVWMELLLRFSSASVYQVLEMYGEAEGIEQMDGLMDRLDDSLDLVDLPAAVRAMYDRTVDFLWPDD